MKILLTKLILLLSLGLSAQKPKKPTVASVNADLQELKALVKSISTVRKDTVTVMIVHKDTTMLMDSGKDYSAQINALQSFVTDTQQQLSAKPNRNDIDALIQRLSQVEQKLSQIPATVDYSAQIKAIQTQVNAIPKPVDYSSAITALQQQIAAIKPGGTIDLSPVLTRIAALENKPAPTVDLSPLVSRITTLENKTPTTVDLTPLKTDIAAIKTQLAAIPKVDVKPIFDTLKNVAAAIFTTQQTVQALPDLYMKGFPGAGTSSNPFENRPLVLSEAEKKALKSAEGTIIYQKDGVKGWYGFKDGVWVLK